MRVYCIMSYCGVVNWTETTVEQVQPGVLQIALLIRQLQALNVCPL